MPTKRLNVSTVHHGEWPRLSSVDIAFVRAYLCIIDSDSLSTAVAELTGDHKCHWESENLGSTEGEAVGSWWRQSGHSLLLSSHFVMPLHPCSPSSSVVCWCCCWCWRGPSSASDIENCQHRFMLSISIKLH